MIRNMGSTDKTIRIVIALIIAVLYYANLITGTIAIVALIIAIVFVVTSFFSFCPLYYIVGVSSCAKKD